jgi:hypothetical protein
MKLKVLALLVACMLGLLMLLLGDWAVRSNTPASGQAAAVLPSRDETLVPWNQAAEGAGSRKPERGSTPYRETIAAVPVQSGESTPHTIDDSLHVSDAERLNYLTNSYARLIASYSNGAYTDEECQQIRLGFARRCIATILHYRGRDLRPEDIDSLGELAPDEFRFSADLAWYSFYRGEFPVFDTLHDGTTTGSGAVAPLDRVQEQLEGLYHEALRAFPDSQNPQLENHK